MNNIEKADPVTFEIYEGRKGVKAINVINITKVK
jgi:hypothetical protein